jgi:hypothetical protein
MAIRDGLYAACALAALGGGCAFGPRAFVDDFSSYRTGDCAPDGGRIGRWTVVSTGFGCVTAAREGGEAWLRAETMRSASPGETHSFLVTGPSLSAPFSLSARLQTVEQSRTGSAPNGWESAWLVWGYADRKHFYYFIPKAGGWELGKRDPAFRGGQRYLIDGKSPAFALGKWTTIKIVQNGRRIFVYADGGLVTAFTDVQRPYERGKVGLYGEDCAARFAAVKAASGEDQLPAGDREDERQ